MGRGTGVLRPIPLRLNPASAQSAALRSSVAVPIAF